MIAASSRTITALRLGLLAAAATGCLSVALLSAPAARAQDATVAPVAPPAKAADPNTVVAKVNGSEIRESDISIAEEELGPSLAQMDPGTRRENIVTFLIDLKLASKAAEDKKIQDREEFKKRLAFTHDRLLMDNLLAVEGKSAATEDAEKKVYEDVSKQISSEQEVHARHILVETEDEAKQVIEELKKGADFAELAKKKSKDPGASDGGDLGFFTKGQMVPEFSDAAFALEPGKISEPVKSQFGWHVIKVEEKRTRKPPEFDKVKPQIEAYVARKAQADFVAKLRENAKIERLDKTADSAPKSDAKPDGKTGGSTDAKPTAKPESKTDTKSDMAPAKKK